MKIISEMTYSVLSGILNLIITLSWLLCSDILSGPHTSCCTIQNTW